MSDIWLDDLMDKLMKDVALRANWETYQSVQEGSCTMSRDRSRQREDMPPALKEIADRAFSTPYEAARMELSKKAKSEKRPKKQKKDKSMSTATTKNVLMSALGDGTETVQKELLLRMFYCYRCKKHPEAVSMQGRDYDLSYEFTISCHGENWHRVMTRTELEQIRRLDHIPRIYVFTDDGNREEARSIEFIKDQAERFGLSVEEAVRHLDMISREDRFGASVHIEDPVLDGDGQQITIDGNSEADTIDKSVRATKKDEIFDKPKKKKHRDIDI